MQQGARCRWSGLTWLSCFWSGGAGHDGDSAGEGTVERPEEKLATGGCGADPFLGGEEGFVGWIGGVGSCWCFLFDIWSRHFVGECFGRVLGGVKV